MYRRTLLRWLATAAGSLPFSALRVWSQTATFPGVHGGTLRELATIVLPSELGPDGVARVAAQFERWVCDYRPAAEQDHGYGVTRLRTKPSSPAGVYIEQLEALREPLANPDADGKRKAVEAAMDRAGIKDLPRSPDGKHVITDLMCFYFHGSDANDLCYRAAIRRDSCRGLEGSENPPPAMKGSA